MRNKILAAFVAGGLLVGAGLLTSVVSAPGTARAEDSTDDSDGRGPVPRILGFLGEVLDGLVGDGTITQNQADAIASAAEEKAQELRDQHMALRQQLSGILDDGVITEEEASELPEDHWLKSDVFDEAWADGELSIQEIRSIRGLRGHPFRRGMRLGALLDDGGIDQSEYDNLPEDNPLKKIDVTDYLDDGLITPSELREIFRDLMGARLGADA